MTQRILHIFGAMDIGGAEMRTIELQRELAEHDIEFDYLTLSGRPGVLEPEITALGGRVIPMKLGPMFPAQFVRLLRRSDYAAVHSHVATFSGAVVALARLGGVPQRIAHFRSDGDGHADTVARRAQRTTMTTLIRTSATHILGVSPSTLSDGYSRTWQDDPRAEVIVNGMEPAVPHAAGPDLRSLAGLGPDTPVLLHVGRPSPEKNRPRAVRVLEAIAARRSDVHLVFVGGTGADADAMAAALAASAVADRVHQIGAVKNAKALMAQADAMVNVSVREGLPGVVLEAAASGTPMVASEVPGAVFIAEQVEGVTVLPLSAPDEEWADAVLAAMSAGQNAETRGVWRAGFEESQFSMNSVVARYIELYRGEEQR